MERSIERVRVPSREELKRRFEDTNTPVILTGFTDHWPAMTQWTPEYLKRVAGDSVITVHYDESGDFHRWYTNPRKRIDRHIPFRELVDLLTTDPQGPRYYMTEHELSRVSRGLVKDVDFARYIDPGSIYEPLLFLGRDTCMPLHYHGTTEGFLCQIQGSKEVILYGPDQFAKLYARPWYAKAPLFSEVDGRNPDLARFPKFGEAVPLRFRLEPGETLYIPVHWWHFTRVQGYQISVTHFWKARLQNWSFPAPGFQVCAREVLFKTKKYWKAARKKLQPQKRSA